MKSKTQAQRLFSSLNESKRSKRGEKKEPTNRQYRRGLRKITEKLDKMKK